MRMQDFAIDCLELQRDSLVSDLKFRLIRSSAACVLVAVSWLAQAQTQTSTDAASATHAAEAAASASDNAVPTQPLVGDDPFAVRDALAKQGKKANAPSLSDRVRKLIHIPAHQTSHDPDLVKAGLDRELTFVVPAPYGILYRAKTRQLSVNVDLSDFSTPGVIVLRKHVEGQSGRGLVVAPEAKAKGYIQHIDLIGLDSGDRSKTSVRGSLKLSPSAFAAANGDFAIAVVCDLVPPYLSDRLDHTDPTSEEPTDITTRTSTLHADVQAIWLVSPQKGIVLSKNLHLSK